MQTNCQERDDENVEKNHSDSDDWTLVSPPDGTSTPSLATSAQEQEGKGVTISLSAPSPSVRCKETIPKKQRKDQIKQNNRNHKDTGEDRRQVEAELELRASGSQDADDEEDDGLVEIDLNVDDEVRSSKSVPERVGQSGLRLRKPTKNVELISPVPIHTQNITKTRDCSTNTQMALVAATTEEPRSAQIEAPKSQSVHSYQEQQSQQADVISNSTSLPISMRECLYTSFILFLIVLICAESINKMIDGKLEKRFSNLLGALRRTNNESEPFDLFYVPPEETAFMYLKKFDSELEACIRERGYGWLKKDGKLSHPKDGNLDGKVYQNPKYKPFRGVVCYENESEWRDKLKKLKEEYNVDLRKLAKQGYKRLGVNLLNEIYPGLRFSLVLNQLDYLDYLDEQRRRQEIEHLKAENLNLKKRLAKCNNADRGANDQFIVGQPSRSLAKLENENDKLKRENDVLKANLVEKAGTVYIKQSLELEKCERENSILRQFHQQVAHEISKSLKQLGLNTIDAVALLNDHESLSAQLSLTRSYLVRLGKEIEVLVTKTKNVEKESEFYRVLLDTLETAPRAKQIGRHNTEPAEDESGVWKKSNFPSSLADAQLNEDQVIEQVGLDLDELRSKENKSSTESDAAEMESQEASSIQQDISADSEPSQSGFRSNWLMRRAKLRERLRKSSGIDILEKHIDRLIDQSKYLYKKSIVEGDKHKYDKETKHNHLHKRLDHSHKHQDVAMQRHDSQPTKRTDQKGKNHYHFKERDTEKRHQEKSILLRQLEAEIANLS